ncbi:nicotinate (nicotinamide) nucleotide adenylyltransferase [candidate division WOR-3 bacterium JGI_Cruoil_03_51_56]|uniref:Probable nicotinate-nucleotide adenylyltransferase n=1 Tax=candidate division WOR-3 bacterium JGI_Cruoil_03_51_56 TaxID=1973747 RepID=A0A235BPZ5_UNCW3|nr:MAG: nicotinate (nicotinamide) nucleotide adenylyltransferase [candidate division WOR-3 bacterium JGI_Cruoil_03_51_56]
MKTGIFGGAFNPIHLAHLLVADDVRRRLKLNRVLFIPTSHPPHKSGNLTPYKRRVAMVKLALKEWPKFGLCTIEEKRKGPSYTVDTLIELKSLYKYDSFYLIIGIDQYQEMSSWHQPGKLTRLARLVVMDRPGNARPSLFPGHDPKHVQFLSVIPIDISSRIIRKRLAKGKSVRYILPVTVLEYIKKHRLYRKKAQEV